MFKPDGAELFLAVAPYLFGVVYVFTSHYLEPMVAERVARRIEDGNRILGVAPPLHLASNFIADYFQYAFACLQLAALAITFPAGLATCVASFDAPAALYLVAILLVVLGVGLVFRFLERDPVKYSAAQRPRRIPTIERWALGCNLAAITIVLSIAYYRAHPGV